MSRMKNVGTLVPKALISMAVAAMAYYAVGFAFAFGNGDIIGSDGFLLRAYGDPQDGVRDHGPLGRADRVQVAVPVRVLRASASRSCGARRSSGSSSTRTRSSRSSSPRSSTRWRRTGCSAAAGCRRTSACRTSPARRRSTSSARRARWPACSCSAPRRGKYGADGAPRPIPGHNMLILGLGMFILLFGWFGFNAGSTLGVTDGRFAEVAMVTMLGAAGGILGAYVATVVLQRTVDIGMVCNGLIAGLVAITAGSGYVENWAAPMIGLVGGLIVVPSIMLIDSKLDDPVGVLSAHGIAGIWGTLACGLFTAPRFAQYAGDRQPRRRPVLLGLVRAARLPGARRGRRLRARARALPGDLVRDRQDDRAAGQRGRRDRGPRHLRARHVRLPGAVHPGRRALRRRRHAGGQARRPRAVARAGAASPRKPPPPEPLPRGFGAAIGRRPSRAAAPPAGGARPRRGAS